MMEAWDPCQIREIQQFYPTSTGPFRVDTDEGPALVKVARPRWPAERLGLEFLGARLAASIGLPVPEVAIIRLTDVDRSRLHDASVAQNCQEPFILEQSWAFAMRFATAAPYDGTSIRRMHREDLALLMAADSWLLNSDRFKCPITNMGNTNPDNLLYGSLPGASRLSMVAIDFGHVFNNGDLPNALPGPATPVALGLHPSAVDRIQPGLIRDISLRIGSECVPMINEHAEFVPDEWQGLADVFSARTTYLQNRGSSMSSWMPAAFEDARRRLRDGTSLATTGRPTTSPAPQP